MRPYNQCHVCHDCYEFHDTHDIHNTNTFKGSSVYINDADAPRPYGEAGASPHVIVGCRQEWVLAGRATDVDGGPSEGSAYEHRVGCARAFGGCVWIGWRHRCGVPTTVVSRPWRNLGLGAGVTGAGGGDL